MAKNVEHSEKSEVPLYRNPQRANGQMGMARPSSSRASWTGMEVGLTRWAIFIPTDVGVSPAPRDSVPCWDQCGGVSSGMIRSKLRGRLTEREPRPGSHRPRPCTYEYDSGYHFPVDESVQAAEDRGRKTCKGTHISMKRFEKFCRKASQTRRDNDLVIIKTPNSRSDRTWE